MKLVIWFLKTRHILATLHISIPSPSVGFSHSFNYTSHSSQISFASVLLCMNLLHCYFSQFL
ncbi:hypothetical protein MtrunA17_Chr6g0462151 [Medicago truncatula]|uniref:Uncharacterized protein n=1 Tax=Medicago truncatula TaxID=3880 RepID=A0A396HE50_MEDTR|nr:hypothetical protein MtrunA17_Chr6g0462151 [Medicago truncatula]